MTGTPKPDPELDYRMNSRGSKVIGVLRVKDVVVALRCSRSHAYQVIRECRGDSVGSALAFILPSQLRDWTLRQLGGLAVPTRGTVELGFPKKAALSAPPASERGARRGAPPRRAHARGARARGTHDRARDRGPPAPCTRQARAHPRAAGRARGPPRGRPERPLTPPAYDASPSPTEADDPNDL